VGFRYKSGAGQCVRGVALQDYTTNHYHLQRYNLLKGLVGISCFFYRESDPNKRIEINLWLPVK
jgi:hypothetical protein